MASLPASNPARISRPLETSREVVRSVDARLTEAALAALAVAGTLVWLPILAWFDLQSRWETPYFALEKLPGQFESPVVRRTLLLFAGAALVYLLAILVIARARVLTARAKGAIVALIVAPVIVCVLIYPIGALDVFNYMVDLRLAYGDGENPYLVTMPAWPEGDPFLRSAFMLHVPLFYGPAWLLLSAIPAYAAGFDAVVDLLLALKLFNVLLLALTGWLIGRAQSTPTRRWLATFVFLGNPLVLFEGVANAHNDVLMTLFVIAALASVRSPARRWLAGPLLALAVLVKLFAAVLAPLLALEAIRARWPRRQWLLAAAGALLVAVVTVAPFWAGGDFVEGYRTGTTQSQEMDHVSPFSLAQQRLKWERVEESPGNVFLARYASHDVVSAADQAALRRWFTAAFVVLTGVTLALWARRRMDTPQAAAVTMILFSLLLTNLYPWYLIPIVALLALRLDAHRLAFIFVGTLLGLAYYPAYVWAHFNSGWDKFDVHRFLAVFLTAPMVAYLLVLVGIPLLRHARSAIASPENADATSR